MDATQPAQADAFDAQVECERVRMIFGQMPTSITGTMVGVLLVTAVMWPAVPAALLLPWMAAMAANQGWRLVLYLRFRKQGLAEAGTRASALRWQIGSAISGLIWSFAAIKFFVSGSPIHQTLLTTSIFAIVAVAVPITASHLPSFKVFVIPILLSLIGRNLWEADAAHLILAFIVVAVLLGVLSVGQRYHRMLTEALRARFENEDLATRLAAQNLDLARARDAAEQAGRAKTHFFASASHDLRQPLHAISLFAGILAGRLRGSEHAPMAENISSSVAVLESHFSQLLDVSRIEAGILEPQPASFDLRALVLRLGKEFSAEAAQKSLRLRVHAPAARVHSDPFLVERILRNLISNAVRYTQRGGVLVAVRLREAEAVLEVWDTGIGIAPEDQQAVFEEFVQLDNPERDLGKGMGLGLSIVKRLAGLLGHPLAMDSRPGRGTRFRLRLPLVAAGAAAELPPPPSLAPGFGDRLVMVIADQPGPRQQTAILLEGWGTRVVPCADALEAEAAALRLERAPDLIVSSQGRAEDGRAAICAVRAHFGQSIPAILAAAKGAPAEAAPPLADLYLMQAPVLPAKLRALVAALLQQAAESAAGLE